jgi:nitronate monooxygenase
VILDELAAPVVLAPLAGGPSTPELAAAVTNAGGLGFLASGYLSVDATAARVSAARKLTAGRLGVNLFTPGSGPSDEAEYEKYLDRLRGWATRDRHELGEPHYSDDDWGAKLALLGDAPVDVVSFTFGCPPAEVIESLQAVGSEVWVTTTSPDEARQAVEAGADVLVTQGAEAGGHRGTFVDTEDAPAYGLLALLQLTRAAVPVPLVASGGLATGEALAAVMCAGARAGQLGSAFLLAPEAGTAAAHRAALQADRATAVTRAFTGRQARGIRNEFMDQHGSAAPVAYPELHYVTAPIRARAREQGDPELINLWAGEAHGLAQVLPAGEIVAQLTTDARAALALARGRLATS